MQVSPAAACAWPSYDAQRKAMSGFEFRLKLSFKSRPEPQILSHWGIFYGRSFFLFFGTSDLCKTHEFTESIVISSGKMSRFSPVCKEAKTLTVV
jgi:hypothetical protein